MDSQDPLQKIPARISFPEVNEKSDLFYRKFFGFATKRTYVDEVMNDWANLAVEGHFTVKTMVGLSRTFCQTTE
jgi:kynureninase